MRWLLAPLLLLVTPLAQAHTSSDAFIQLQVQTDRIEQRLDIALRDLDRDLALDADGDGVLTWGEVRRRWPEIEALADAGLTLQADGAACRPQVWGAAQLEQHSDGAYAVLSRSWRCAAPVQTLSLDYRLFAATDAGHRGLVRLVGAQGEPLMLTPGAGPQRLDVRGASRGFLGFVIEGMGHIASGPDHLLFLASLLLPVALALRGRRVYRRWIVPAGFGVVAILASLWLVKRSLAVSLFP